MQFSPFFNGGARTSNYSFFGQTKKKNSYRITDYHSIYPDVFGDADSIPSPLPPTITAELDIQITPGAASGALASLTEFESTSPRSYAEEMQQLTDACRAFLDQIQRGAAPWVVQRLNYIYGPMPTDPTHFSYWMAMVSIFFSFLSMFGHARMQARHVRACAIADRDKPTGPAYRRYGKGQTSTSELAAASSSVSSALDRAIEQSLVRRRACHGRRIRMRINPDAFTLGGSRMAALFHDNAGDSVCPMDEYGGFESINYFTSASCRLLVRASPPLAGPCNPSSPVALSVFLAYHPCILFPSCASQQTQDDDTSPPFFFLINTSDFVFVLRFAIGTCMLQLTICK